MSRPPLPPPDATNRCKAVVKRNVRSFDESGTLQRETHNAFASLCVLSGQFSQPLLGYEERLFHALKSCLCLCGDTKPSWSFGSVCLNQTKKEQAMKRTILVLFLMGIGVKAYAAYTDGDWEFEAISESAKTARIVKYKGSEVNVNVPSSVKRSEQYKDKDGEIHTRYYTYNVLEVKGLNQSVEVVYLPSSVKTVSQYAFYGNTNLQTIDLISVETIGYSAFEGCSSITSLKAPNLTSIGSKAFQNCTGLTSVEIDGASLKLDSQTFSGCTSLETCALGDGVTSISDSNTYDASNSPFYGCNKLKEISFGRGITKLPERLLYKHATLEKCSMSSVTSIDNVAFLGCSGLKEVIGLEKIVSFGSSTFYGCSSISGELNLDSAVTIGSEAFYGCKGITSVRTKHLTRLYSKAFQNCTGLTSVEIDGASLKLDSQTFSGCTSLETCALGDGVTSISDSNTYDASNSPFYGCNKLKEISFGRGITKLPEHLLYNHIVLERCNLAFVTSIGKRAFMGCAGLKEVTGLENVVSFEGAAFTGCSSMHGELNLSSASKLGEWAFSSCSSITSLKAPNLTSMGSKAFQNCTGLTSVEIDGRNLMIGTEAFKGCISLRECVLGAGVTGVQDYNLSWSSGSAPFNGCGNLSVFSFMGTPFVVPKYSFYGIMSGAVGYYTAEYAAEWEKVIPSSGVWNYLIMKKAKQPKLEITSVDWVNGSIKLDWSKGEDGEEVNWPCTLYRGTSPSFAEAKAVEGAIGTTRHPLRMRASSRPRRTPLRSTIGSSLTIPKCPTRPACQL